MAIYNKDEQSYIPANTTLHEVVMTADKFGDPIQPASVDSHGILPTSNKEYYFSSTFLYSDRPDLWDTVTTGSGSIAHNPVGTVDVTVTGAGDSVLRQTTKLVPYFPGRKVQATFAGRFDPSVQATVTQRFGLFDVNDGLFFEIDSGGLKVVIRNATDDSRFAYTADWNIDKLDGTGPSRKIIDPSKFQVGIIEFEWYGGGRVKFGLIIEDDLCWVHYFDNSNFLDAPFMSSSVLPLSFQAISTGGSTTISQGSSTAALLGEIPKTGQPRFVSNDLASPITITTAGVFYRAISVRLNPLYPKAIALYSRSNVFGTDNSTYQFRVSVQDTFRDNGDTVDSDPNTWTWVDVPGSILQYSIPASVALPERVVDTSGIAFEGSLFDGKIGPSETGVSLDSFIGQLGRKVDNTSDIWTVSVAAAGSNKSAFGKIYWTELVK